jgi:pimeloyl-ACP methyl ester carboxylesterase
MKIVWSGRSFITLFVISFVFFFVIGTRAEKQDVAFRAADGFTLRGSFYSAEKPVPAVLLLHPCDGDSHLYDHLASLLNTAGYNVLTFDFRGFGASRAAEYTDPTAQRPKIIDQMPGDIDAALNFLTSQSTVNPRSVGLVAADCAVNQAVHAARRHPTVRTLVLLSGGTDAEGEAYIKDSPRVPILGVASDEDSAAAAATKKLVAVSTNNDSHLEMFSNAGHAAFIFAKQPDLEPDIVIWFISNLPLAGYGLPPAIK